MKSVDLLRAQANDYRLDWSEFDGRTAKAQLNRVADLIERENNGEDVTDVVNLLLEELAEREREIIG